MVDNGSTPAMDELRQAAVDPREALRSFGLDEKNHELAREYLWEVDSEVRQPKPNPASLANRLEKVAEIAGGRSNDRQHGWANAHNRRVARLLGKLKAELYSRREYKRRPSEPRGNGSGPSTVRAGRLSRGHRPSTPPGLATADRGWPQSFAISNGAVTAIVLESPNVQASSYRRSGIDAVWLRERPVT